MHEETLRGGHPCLRFGQGPRLVVLPGLIATHTAPIGFDRRGQTGMLRHLAGAFTVYWINRRPGLAAGTTMADLGDHYAEALEDLRSPQKESPTAASRQLAAGTWGRLAPARHYRQ